MSVGLILLIVAAVCFLVATIGWPTGPVNIQSLGLFFLTLAIAVGSSTLIR